MCKSQINIRRNFLEIFDQEKSTIINFYIFGHASMYPVAGQQRERGTISKTALLRYATHARHFLATTHSQITRWYSTLPLVKNVSFKIFSKNLQDFI